MGGKGEVQVGSRCGDRRVADAGIGAVRGDGFLMRGSVGGGEGILGTFSTFHRDAIRNQTETYDGPGTIVVASSKTVSR